MSIDWITSMYLSAKLNRKDIRFEGNVKTKFCPMNDWLMKATTTRRDQKLYFRLFTN